MVNVTAKQLGKNVRMSFGKIPEVLDMPNLIEIQKNSYKWFREEGLGEVFRDFSATDYNGNPVLTFTGYRFDDEHLKYKTIAKADQDVPMQFTIVWGIKDLAGITGLAFTGFADFWWETLEWGEDKTKGVFISEPQVWYNIGQHFGCDNLHLGGEVELAYNFAGAWRKNYVDNKGFNASPCLGLKWVF